jgi:hypothetical protein
VFAENEGSVPFELAPASVPDDSAVPLDGGPETARGFGCPIAPETAFAVAGEPKSGVVADPRPFAPDAEAESVRRVEASSVCELIRPAISSALGEIRRESGQAVTALVEFDSTEVLVECEGRTPFVSEDTADLAEFEVPSAGET